MHDVALIVDERLNLTGVAQLTAALADRCLTAARHGGELEIGQADGASALEVAEDLGMDLTIHTDRAMRRDP